ncbi:hypothetical protein FRB90_007823, partial [Tulasnella sp. 427]
MNGLSAYGNSDDEERHRSSSFTRKRMHAVEPKIKTKAFASSLSNKSSPSTSTRTYTSTQSLGSVHPLRLCEGQWKEHTRHSIHEILPFCLWASPYGFHDSCDLDFGFGSQRTRNRIMTYRFDLSIACYGVSDSAVRGKLEREMPSLKLDSRSHSSSGKSEGPAGMRNRENDSPSRHSKRHYLLENEDESSAIRRISRPPPIPGSNDEEYDIPPCSETPCDPELDAKVLKFHLLKRQGKHFNDTLMQNKAFRNPHIYAKLVDFVSVDETSTNFPKDIWNPFDLREEWYAENIAAQQKERSAKLAAAQTPGARTRIAFESSTTSSFKGKERE